MNNATATAAKAAATETVVNPLTNLLTAAAEAKAAKAAAAKAKRIEAKAAAEAEAIKTAEAAAKAEAERIEAEAEAKAAEKEPASKRTIKRRERNKAGKVRLLNFTAVFKDVRANDFGLPNKVKESHIIGKEKQIKVICLNLCSVSLKVKSENHFYFNRFPKLVTDLNYLKSFMTEKQLSSINDKIWTNMAIMDLIVKGLTSTESSIKKA